MFVLDFRSFQLVSNILNSDSDNIYMDAKTGNCFSYKIILPTLLYPENVLSI